MLEKKKELQGRMNNKEDLIGTTIKCPHPYCNVTFILTEEGHNHWGNKHYYSTTLEEQWDFYLLGQEQMKMMLY